MKETFVQPKVEEERSESKVEKLWVGLKENYVDQVRLMNENGIIELLPESGELGIVDINGDERPVPDYDELVEYLESKVEEIEPLIENGFTRLQLTPIGMDLNELKYRIDVYLWRKRRAVAEGTGDRELCIPKIQMASYGRRQASPFMNSTQFSDKGLKAMTYDVNGYEERVSKQELLRLQEVFAGWQIGMSKLETRNFLKSVPTCGSSKSYLSSEVMEEWLIRTLSEVKDGSYLSKRPYDKEIVLGSRFHGSNVRVTIFVPRNNSAKVTAADFLVLGRTYVSENILGDLEKIEITRNVRL